MKNIIIVDMQEGFINDNNKHLVDKINTYLTSNKFDNIFFTKCINNNESPYIKILNWNSLSKYKSKSFENIALQCFRLSSDYTTLNTNKG